MNGIRIVVVYKTAPFQKYFLCDNCDSSFMAAHKKFRFPILRQDYESHEKTLKLLKNILKKHNLSFDIFHRDEKIKYSKYDFIITVGGDGTFLKAARYVKDQIMIGLNSSPLHSVGKLCFFNSKSIEKAIHAISLNKFKTIYFDRLALNTSSKIDNPILALNDILICHKSPAAMSHYIISLHNVEEEQRGSGIWIASPAGSTAGIASAGGKILPLHSHKFQFLSRELFPFKNRSYKLKSAVLNKTETITITSLMDNGSIYIDGTHYKIPFPYGCLAQINLSNQPIQLLNL